jgi:hypothetical protein
VLQHVDPEHNCISEATGSIMGTMKISLKGKPLFTWEGDDTAVENILQAVPEAASFQQRSAEDLAFNSVFYLQEGELLGANEVSREMQMMCVIYFFLQQETGNPDRPGKFAIYAANTDFDVDFEIDGSVIRMNVGATSKFNA